MILIVQLVLLRIMYNYISLLFVSLFTFVPSLQLYFVSLTTDTSPSSLFPIVTL
jgi:hypothetical protein